MAGISNISLCALDRLDFCCAITQPTTGNRNKFIVSYCSDVRDDIHRKNRYNIAIINRATKKFVGVFEWEYYLEYFERDI